MSLMTGYTCITHTHTHTHTHPHTHTHTHYKGTLDTFANEAALLRKISQHKCLVAAPSVQVLNFSDPSLHGFYKSLPGNKQQLVRELFRTGTCLEVFMYPLYGVTMATKIKVSVLDCSVRGNHNYYK